ncbi:MAG: helix-turn-helix domain-containing protein [Clostridia bacterium]|nr:helix-turn-helix domain-containing protein [Clostridia bacterium]
MNEKTPLVLFKKGARRSHLFFQPSLFDLLPNSDFLHYHDVLELGVCLSGSGRYLTPNGETPFRAGDVQVIMPFHPHYNVADEGGSLWAFVDVDLPRIHSPHISADPAYFLELVRKLSVSGIYTEGCNPETVSSVRGIVRLMRTEGAGESPVLDLIVAKLQALLLELSMLGGNENDSVEIEKKSSAILPAIRAASKAVEFGEKISVCEMASACFMSDSYFRKLFGEVMGESPKKYLLHLQTQKAAALLVTTDLSVGEIAEQTCAEDFSTFYRRFVKVYGVSPDAYRRDAGKRVFSGAVET